MIRLRIHICMEMGRGQTEECSSHRRAVTECNVDFIVKSHFPRYLVVVVGQSQRARVCRCCPRLGCICDLDTTTAREEEG